MIFTREYIARVLKVEEQFSELNLPPPRDRMPSSYYNVIRKLKRVYISTSEGVIAKFKARTGRCLEKNI